MPQPSFDVQRDSEGVTLTSCTVRRDSEDVPRASCNKGRFAAESVQRFFPSDNEGYRPVLFIFLHISSMIKEDGYVCTT